MDYSTRRTLIERVADFVGLNSRFHKYQENEIDWDDSVFVSPVEARLVYIGEIKRGGRLVSKLGRKVDLAGVVDESDLFSDGFYMNFYLSPVDKHYWRIPYDSEVVSTKVNNGVARIPVITGLERIFPRANFFEKSIKKNATIGTVFRARDFSYAMIAVGSLNVNSIHTIKKDCFKKGDIGGYFNFGSSMLLCFSKSMGNEFLVDVGDKVDVGEEILRLP